MKRRFVNWRKSAGIGSRWRRGCENARPRSASPLRRPAPATRCSMATRASHSARWSTVSTLTSPPSPPHSPRARRVVARQGTNLPQTGAGCRTSTGQSPAGGRGACFIAYRRKSLAGCGFSSTTPAQCSRQVTGQAISERCTEDDLMAMGWNGVARPRCP